MTRIEISSKSIKPIPQHRIHLGRFLKPHHQFSLNSMLDLFERYAPPRVRDLVSSTINFNLIVLKNDKGVAAQFASYVSEGLNQIISNGINPFVNVESILTLAMYNFLQDTAPELFTQLGEDSTTTPAYSLSKCPWTPADVICRYISHQFTPTTVITFSKSVAEIKRLAERNHKLVKRNKLFLSEDAIAWNSVGDGDYLETKIANLGLLNINADSDSMKNG